MSPKKVRLVADAIRGLGAAEALVRLRFMQKASSPILAKLVKSAMANAQHNNNVSPDSLMIKRIVVNEGVALKRWRPAAFGSAHQFKKRSTHVDLVLGLKPGIADPSEKKSKTKEAASDISKKTEAKVAEIAEAPKKAAVKKPIASKKEKVRSKKKE